MMNGALNRMRNLHLYRAWEKWQYIYAEQKRQMFMMTGALNRMRNLKLSQAWESWQDWYAEVIRQRDMLYRCVQHMRHRALSRALLHWRSRALDAPVSESQDDNRWPFEKPCSRHVPLTKWYPDCSPAHMGKATY